ncbi:MAG TPA: hypothetical protein VF729_01860 [Solirubrobacterales bacterium]
MRSKLNAITVGLLVAIGTGALAVGATAKEGGHFVSPGSNSTMIKWSEVGGTNHQLEFTLHGLEGGVVCDEVFYEEILQLVETTTETTIMPTYKKCHTTGQGAGTTTINANGCTFLMKVAAGTTATTEQTIKLTCPAGSSLEIAHPNCTITIPQQIAENAATYTTMFISPGILGITMDMNAGLAAQYHAGICVFTGTGHTATLSGSLTVQGTNWVKQTPVSITAT